MYNIRIETENNLELALHNNNIIHHIIKHSQVDKLQSTNSELVSRLD